MQPGQLIHSYTREKGGNKLSGPASLAELLYSGRHFTYSGTYEDRSPNFRAPLGFIQRVDIRQSEQFASYLWRPEGRRVLSFGPSVSALVNVDRQGRVQDWSGGGDFGIFFAGAAENIVTVFCKHQ